MNAQPSLFVESRAVSDGAPFADRPGRATLSGQLAAFFQARPGEWIDGRELSTVAGAYAWRSRVSDLRRAPYLMTIENRQRREGPITVSEYKFLPTAQDVDARGAA